MRGQGIDLLLGEGVVMSCIYCKAELGEKTEVAHVWQASLGGRLRSRRISCDGCNHAFGVIEDELQQALRHTNAAVGATRDDGEPIWTTHKAFGREFVLAGGNAVLRVARTRFERERNRIVVPLPAGKEAQVEALTKAFWDQGYGPEDLDQLDIEPGDPPLDLPVGPTRHDHNVAIGGRVEHKRVFAKMALELLAFHRHDLAVRGELSEARRFARHGGGSLESKPDLRSPGTGLLTALVLPELWNSIEIWSHSSVVHFRVVFLGAMRLTGTLSTSWSADSFRAIYAFDARNPTQIIRSELLPGDGLPLSIWVPAMKPEAEARFVDDLEAASLKLCRSAARITSEPVPDIEELRSLVRARLAAMKPKTKHKKKRGDVPRQT